MVNAESPDREALDVQRAAEDAPAAEALVGEACTWTFRELGEAVERRGAALRAAGCSAGDRIVYTPARTLDACVDLLTLLALRVEAVLVHPRFSPSERHDAIERLGGGLVWAGGQLSGRRPARSSPSSVVVFSSGSTGAPKAVRLSLAALTAACRAHALHLGWKARDRVWLGLPLAHVGGLLTLLRSLYARKPVVIGEPLRGPSPRLEEERVTQVSMVPTTLHRIVQARYRAPACLRAVLLGGAAVAPRLLRQGRELGWPLLPTYGATESAAQVCTQHPDAPRPTGVGRPLAGMRVRIRDGVIEVAGPTLMDGFWPGSSSGAPSSPEQGFVKHQGWWRTADRGRLDAEGHLHVLGRVDDVIVTGGENVDPLEVEHALSALAEVEAAAVVGTPDPEWGDCVTAVVVPARAGIFDERPLPEARWLRAIRDALRGQLADFKRPRRLLFCPELPRRPGGKLDRAALRSWVAGQR